MAELEQMTKDAFRDPMQEMIDKYADMADQNLKVVQNSNSTQNSTT